MSEKEKKAVIDLLSLLGLSLDSLIIEEFHHAPKLPIDQLCEHQRPHRLILSIKAPLEQEDLFQASNCTTQIKRTNIMQQKMAFFVMPPKSNNSVHLEDTKSSWIPITKEDNLQNGLDF